MSSAKGIESKKHKPAPEIVEKTKPIGKLSGRPTKYTEEIGDSICSLLAQGNSLKTALVVLKRDTGVDINMASVFNWIGQKGIFFEKYNNAIAERTEALAEELLDIADDGSNDFMLIKKGDKEYSVENKEVTNRSRLRVDTRKWLMSKMKPKKYGDRVDVTTNGEKITGFNFIKNEIVQQLPEHVNAIEVEESQETNDVSHETPESDIIVEVNS